MKKRIFALLLSAPLLANATACNTALEKDVESTFEDTSTELTMDETEKDDSNSNYDYFETKNRSIYSSYVGNSAYIQKQNDLFITEIDGQSYFYIPKWEKYFSIPSDFSDSYENVCGFVGQETAWIFEYEFEQTGHTNGEATIFTMFKIHRETDVPERTTISLPVYIYENFGSVFCNMLDENTGFLFVFAYKDQAMQLVSLAKTMDGGENWSTIQRDMSWYSGNWRDALIVSHFFDENNGMIVARASAGGNASHVYITLDGGKTWDWARIPFSDYDSELIGAENRYLELANFEKLNETYILTFRLCVGWGEGANGKSVSFSSTDLKTWTYLP